MADLTEIQSSQAVKLTDGSENGYASIGTFNGDNSSRAIRAISEVANIPYCKVVYDNSHFLLGGSDDMNVNGSVTPQNFVYAPPSGQVWYVESVSIIFLDAGTPTAQEFGNITSLTNGVRLIATIDSVEYTICHVQNNGQLTLCFLPNNYAAGVGGGWLDDQDAYAGSKVFHVPIRLNGTNGDKLTFRISDNLTGIDVFVATGNSFRVIG